MYYINAAYSVVFGIITMVWNGIVGFCDALNPRYPLSLYYHSTTIKRVLNSIMTINMLMLVFNYVLYSIGNMIPFVRALNWTGWFMPMWILSDYVNRLLQNEMMEKLCKDKYSKKENQSGDKSGVGGGGGGGGGGGDSNEKIREKNSSSNNISINKNDSIRQVTDVLYETVFFACIHFLLFLSNSYWSKTLYLIGYSLVCSYSMLAYRLSYTNFTLHAKFNLFEKYWVYFIFYGLPYGLVYVSLPAAISYPCFYILVGWTLPNTLHVLPRKGIVLPFKIFYLPEYLVNNVSLLLPKIMQRKEKKN